MSDAPDRIWAAPDIDDGWRWPDASKFPMQGYSPGVQVSYTRTDLADAAHRAGYEAARADALAMGVGLLNYDAFMRHKAMTAQPSPATSGGRETDKGVV